MGKLALYVASKHPELLAVRGVAYEVVGHYKADEPIYGKLKPGAPELDDAINAVAAAEVSGNETEIEAARHGLAEIHNQRYSAGLASPWKQDLSVLPAISLIPTPDAANRGWYRGGETMIDPSPLLASWGISTMTETDWEDYRALYLFQEKVVGPALAPMPASPATPVHETSTPSSSSASVPASLTPIPPIPLVDPYTLTLAGFKVQIIFNDPRYPLAPPQRAKVAPACTTEESGTFWFFGPANYEVHVKLLVFDSGHLLLFAAPLTNVEWSLNVASPSGAVVYHKTVKANEAAVIQEMVTLA